MSETQRPAPEGLSDHITENIEGVVALQRREWDATSASQRRFERVSRFVGRPAYLTGVLVFVVAWMAFNLGCDRFGLTPSTRRPSSGSRCWFPSWRWSRLRWC